jgi:hypothetical protein
MRADTIAATKPNLGRLASLFNVRYLLGRYGYDPCDEWNPSDVLGLPDGLTYRNGRIEYDCVRCGNPAEWPVEVELFVEGDDMNLCGGSPRCCP